MPTTAATLVSGGELSVDSLASALQRHCVTMAHADTKHALGHLLDAQGSDGPLRIAAADAAVFELSELLDGECSEVFPALRIGDYTAGFDQGEEFWLVLGSGHLLVMHRDRLRQLLAQWWSEVAATEDALNTGRTLVSQLPQRLQAHRVDFDLPALLHWQSELARRGAKTSFSELAIGDLLASIRAAFSWTDAEIEHCFVPMARAGVGAMVSYDYEEDEVLHALRGAGPA